MSPVGMMTHPSTPGGVRGCCARCRAVPCCGDKSVPAGDLHPSGRSSLDPRSCCKLLCGVKNPCGNFCVAFSGEVDIVAVRDLLQAGEPVLLGVWSLSETVHDVDDFVVGDASCVE